MNDQINRQDAIVGLKALAVPLYKDPACEDIWERDRTLVNSIDVLRGLPSAEPEPKTGMWIEHKDYPGLAYLCSECGRFTTERSHFCPDCGAKMEDLNNGKT